MSNKISLIKKGLLNLINNIDAGNTNLTEEESDELINILNTFNKGNTTVSKAYACERILHITNNQFKYLLAKGVIPSGRKEYGFKELRWKREDFNDAIEYLKKK